MGREGEEGRAREERGGKKGDEGKVKGGGERRRKGEKGEERKGRERKRKRGRGEEGGGTRKDDDRWISKRTDVATTEACIEKTSHEYMSTMLFHMCHMCR